MRTRSQLAQACERVSAASEPADAAARGSAQDKGKGDAEDNAKERKEDRAAEKADTKADEEAGGGEKAGQTEDAEHKAKEPGESAEENAGKES